MPFRPDSSSYEPVTNPKSKATGATTDADDWLTQRYPVAPAKGFKDPFEKPNKLASDSAPTLVATEPALTSSRGSTKRERTSEPVKYQILKRGHLLSYIGLFIFTLLVYVRPYELSSSLLWLSTSAFWVAIATLVVFVPTQLGLENNITVKAREVKLLLLLSVFGILSVSFSIDRLESWNTFVVFIKIVIMFIVMVNVVRTEFRWKGLVLLSLAISIIVSIGAIDDFRMGRLKLGGVRIEGVLAGLFENPNDMALHLVTMIPIVVGLMLGARGVTRKIVYLACAGLMFGGVVVSFSRGGFLGLAAAGAVMAWKLRKRSPMAVIGVTVIAVVLFVALLPSGYSDRLASLYNRDLDTGSMESRQELLKRSLHVAARHPLLGIGMGNFHYVSIHEQVSHNAYTQIGAEIGLVAMAIYVLFIVTSLKRMRQIERETGAAARPGRFYYLALGLQASLIGYMVSSFFASVAYNWYVYYLVGYAFCLERIYAATKEPDTGVAAPESVRSALT